MDTILLVIELFVTLALIGIVLIQRSEGGGLGIGGSQGMGSFMSGRGTANLLTRATAILAAIFMVLAIAIGLLHRAGTGNSILTAPAPISAPATSTGSVAATPNAVPGTAKPPAKTPGPAASPAAPKPVTPTAPAAPSAPTGPSVPTQ